MTGTPLTPGQEWHGAVGLGRARQGFDERSAQYVKGGTLSLWPKRHQRRRTEDYMRFVEHRFWVSFLSPLLQHNPASMVPTSNVGTIGKKKIPTPAEEAERGIYRDSKGQMVHPVAGLRSALIKAARGKKAGKRSAPDVVKSAVLPVDEYVILVDPDSKKPLKEYQIDTRRVLVQRNGIMRSRPRHERWAFEVRLAVDEDVINPEQIVPLLQEAGLVAALGDFRVEKGGTFGRFTAELIE